MSNVLQTLGFGAGIIWAFPTAGQTGTNLTPVEIGTIQNIKLTISAAIQELYGLYSFPVDSAIGKRSIKGTAGFAQLEGTAWNNLMFGEGGSAAAGAGQITSYRESGTVPAATPYTISVTNAANFVQDGGVRYADTGEPLEAVTGTPSAAGQYSVSAGVYTFDAADTGKKMLITYSYSSATDGQTFTVTNTPMGTGPVVGLQLLFPYQAPSNGSMDRGIYLPYVRFGKLDLTTKIDNYTEENTEFSAFANPNTGTVMQLYLPW